MPDKAERFAASFKKVWAETSTPNGNKAFRTDKKERTKLMLSNAPPNRESVLRRAAREFDHGADLHPRHASWYTVDLLVTRAKEIPSSYEDSSATDGPLRDYWRYMAEIAIEHENGCDVETELWKLVHWRCPLKVLTFYDFDLEDRKTGRKYNRDKSLGKLADIKEWLPRKLDQMNQIICASHEVFTNGDGEYLFIVGQPHNWLDGAEVRWSMFEWDALSREILEIS